MAYANGQWPDSALARTSTGHIGSAAAVASYERLNAAFYARFGKRLNITDFYRDLATQVRIFEDRYRRTYQGVNDRRGPWRGAYWWRRAGTAAAAVPGTSLHGIGVAADFGSNVNRYGTPENNWMRTNAAAYGWIWPTWARKSPYFEPWHYEYDPERDTRRVNNPIGGGGSVTIPNLPGSIPEAPKEWLDMVDEADLRRIVREEAAQGLLVASKRTFLSTVREAVFDHQIRDESDGKLKKFATFIAYLNKGFAGSRQIVIDALRGDIAKIKTDSTDPAEVARIVVDLLGPDLAKQVAPHLTVTTKG